MLSAFRMSYYVRYILKKTYFENFVKFSTGYTVLTTFDHMFTSAQNFVYAPK